MLTIMLVNKSVGEEQRGTRPRDERNYRPSERFAKAGYDCIYCQHYAHDESHR